MPGMNRTILTSLWSHNYFRSLSSLEKFVYLFLLAGPYTSELSVFPFPIAYLAPYLSITAERLTEAIVSLADKDLIIYDWDTEEVLVLHFFRNHSPNAGIKYEMYRNDLRDIESESLIDAIINVAQQYTISQAFYAALADRRPSLLDPQNVGKYKFKEKELKPWDTVRNAAKEGRENR